ncbi:MAG: universal stress protein [Planctomycetota bacterium]|jgi:nucleotide-binding universal stress UspA family protein
MFRSKRILVPVHLGPTSEKVVRVAARMAEASKGRLLLFHVFDERAVEDVYNLHGLRKGEVQQRMKENAEAFVKKLLRRKALKSLKVDVRYASGLPPEEIVKAATDWKADLLLLTRRRRGGLAHLLYGETADQVVREAPCHVLVLKP